MQHKFYDPSEKPVGACVISARCTNGLGYAVRRFNGKNVREHRVSYCVANNVALTDIVMYQVMHLCDTRNCVNPNHLRLGTHADNMYDRDTKGRTNTGKLPGQANPNVKLTAEQVQIIWELAHYNELGIAKLFGVSKATVNAIWSQRNWKHLTSTLKGNFKPHSTLIT